MDIVWTLEKIENYKRASEYTAFHKKLSVLAEPYLDESWTMADIGCGPGLVDFWLAPMVASIDAIDNDSGAIEYLSKRLDEAFNTNRNIAERIRPRLASVFELGGESWDVVTASFFGADKDMLVRILSFARRRALIFMHGRQDEEGPLASLDDGGKFTAEEMETFLSEKNFKYKKSVMEMEFGQPFRTIGDIHSFISAAAGVSGDDSLKRMTDIEERIIKTDRFDYPYYLPKRISVAMFIILTGQSALE